MGRLKQFFVNYTNNQQVYYPGQTVSGQVVLEITEPVTARGIRVTLRGESYVHWTEQRGSGNHRHTVSYSDRDTYFNHRITVWGKEDGDRSGENPVLPPGLHTFPFIFKLPTGIPSSFEPRGPFQAFIRYWVTANVDRPWKFDIKSKRPFTVIEYIDINNPEFLTPLRSENDKHLCCLCCKSGPLSLQASIDRAGYCPGESVFISASAENLTNREMPGIRAQLISVTSVFARGHVRANRIVLCEMMGETLAVGATDKWENRPFPIIPAPPSIKSCRIIDHSYFMQVCVVVPRGINLKIRFPVVVGTIPLRVAAPPPMQQIAFIDNRVLGNHGLPQAMPLPQVEPIVPSAPPSYAEATGGQSINIADNDDQYTYGNLQYVPLYPFAASGAPLAVSPQEAVTQSSAPPAHYPYPPTEAYLQAGQPPYAQQGQLPYPPHTQPPYTQSSQPQLAPQGQSAYPTGSQPPYLPQYPEPGSLLAGSPYPPYPPADHSQTQGPVGSYGVPLQPMGQQNPGPLPEKQNIS